MYIKITPHQSSPGAVVECDFCHRRLHVDTYWRTVAHKFAPGGVRCPGSGLVSDEAKRRREVKVEL